MDPNAKNSNRGGTWRMACKPRSFDHVEPTGAVPSARTPVPPAFNARGSHATSAVDFVRLHSTHGRGAGEALPREPEMEE